MTVTLLAFLVILLVGLAAYTRIETAVAGNTQRQAQARQNALLGLNVALSQLQKNAGPDQRVTATAESVPNVNAEKLHYTGVWDTTQPAGSPTWLVSGSETGAAVDVTAGTPAAQAVELVGKNTSNVAYDVVVPLVDVKTYGVPGQFANDNAARGGTTIGRYAWWVGDQGVKAPVALADSTNTNPTLASSPYHYSPYSDYPDILSRTRQQISLGAGAADAAGAAVFEPRNTTGTAASPSNATLSGNVTATNQLAFLKTATGTVGLTTLQQNYHSWSPNNFSVLANTKFGGLRQDLSLRPDLLGNGFAAWANYDPANGGYMEAPVAGSANPPSPDYSSDPIRRRYFMQNGPPLISPVLSFFLLSFNVRTTPTASGGPSNSVQPLQVRVTGAFTFWNPYSSALVPEGGLRLDISGLPANVRLTHTNSVATSQLSIPLAGAFAVSDGSLRIDLPWSTTTAGDTRASWLPGRAYSWTIKQDLSGNTPKDTGYASQLNSQMGSAVYGDGVVRTFSGVLVDGSDSCELDFGRTTRITAKLVAVRSTGDVPLATFTSPTFQPFHAVKSSVGAFTYNPTFVFRLAESDNGSGGWLTTVGLDPRQSPLPGDAAYVVGTTGAVNGPFPDLYPGVITVSAPERLLDRDVASYSYDEDVPVFELPRSPILSLGELQHLQLTGQRPFAVGNSWGMGAQLNGVNVSELFDRYYFSGLVPSVTPVVVGGVPLLPNPALKVLPRNSVTGANVALADLQGALDGESSKFLLQGGAFNLNSVSLTAWVAVLRAVRFVSTNSTEQFAFLNANFSGGTAGDSRDRVPGSSTRAEIKKLPTDPEVGESVFLRFSQSAQETYKSFPGYAASTVDPESGAAPNPVSNARTDLYRKGMRKLTAPQVATLATKITDAIKARRAISGPFRSLEEFLAPVSGGPSLIEQAIIDADAAGAQINVDAAGNPIEFSSQYLTQADIMTALAPVLFPRSDTFIIRSYGEAVNPTTGATEGKAWCEATVQRVPEYFDKAADAEEVGPAALTSALNQTYGRRFKVVSFRWLTRSDI